MTASTPARHRTDSETPSVGELVKDATTQASALVRGEIELAKLELTASAKNAGLGAGLILGTLVLVVFAAVFGFIALAEGLVALGLDRWLAYLIVFAFLLLVAGLFFLVGFRFVKRVAPPRRTIATTRDSVTTLKHAVSSD